MSVRSRSRRFPEPRGLGTGEPAVIAHLKGRERALEAFGLTGRVDHAGEPARRRVHPQAAVGLARGQPLQSAPARAGFDGAPDRNRGDSPGPEGLPCVCARRLSGTRCRGCPAPQDHLDRGGRSPPALVRLRDRASGPARAPDRAGGGGRVRGARHPPLPDARPGLPWRGGRRAALLPPRDAGRRCGRMACRSRPSGSHPPETVAAARREIARIEGAILGMDDEAVTGIGGFQACLRRIAEMRELLRSARPESTIDAHSVWRSSRLSGVRI